MNAAAGVVLGVDPGPRERSAGQFVDDLALYQAQGQQTAAARSLYEPLVDASKRMERRRHRRVAAVDLDLQAMRSTSACWRVHVQERRDDVAVGLLERLRRDVLG